MPSRASSPRTMPKAARPGSASSRPTARACSTGFARASPSAGANIIDARIHTTRDGMALDNLLVLDGRGQPYADRRLRGRLVKAVEAALTCRRAAAACRRPKPPRRTQRVRSRAVGRDRRARVDAERRSSRSTRATARRCSPRSPRAIHDCGHTIHSAHIATYGERAVDVFYLTAPGGHEAQRRARSTALRARSCCEAAREPSRGESRLAQAALAALRLGAGGGGGGGGGGGSAAARPPAVAAAARAARHRAPAPAASKPSLPRRVTPKVRGSPRNAP